MYEGFCYEAFKFGIMKDVIDNTDWSELAILLHQWKIDSEDSFISILESEEGMN
jgi:hypothetical protein